MGPLEMMFSWQSLLCALAVVGVMKAVVTVIDLTYGKLKRKRNRWLSLFVLPALTVVLGGVYAVLVPARPEVLVEYAAEHIESTWTHLLAFAAWGAACGQFAQTLYDRAADLIRAQRR